MLIETSAKFVKAFNHELSELDITNLDDLKKLDVLKEQICSKLKLLENSEEIVRTTLNRLAVQASEIAHEPIFVKSNGVIKALIAKDVVKPTIRPIVKITGECRCVLEDFGEFQKHSNGYILIEKEDLLFEIDSQLDRVCLAVFDHDYRSFEGFTCFLALYTPNGNIYIIDALKLRDVLSGLRLFTCSVKKAIHCQSCVSRLLKDFGNIGCYLNFDIPEPEYYIDWRIRPLSHFMMSYICQALIEIFEKINLKIPMEKHIPEPVDEVLKFKERFGLSMEFDVLSDILRLRTYLARVNNESVNYVLTDCQVFNMLVNNPTTIEEFETIFDKMSSVLRLHVMDFIIILKNRSKGFSMDNLKLRGIEEAKMSNRLAFDQNSDRYRKI